MNVRVGNDIEVLWGKLLAANYLAVIQLLQEQIEKGQLVLLQM